MKGGTAVSEPYSSRRALRWIWLGCIPEPGTAAGDLITEHFHGDIDAIYEADREEYREIKGLSENIIDRLCDKSLDFSEEVAEYCAGHGVDLLCPDMPAFPARLAGIQRRPLLLYVRGVLPPIDENVCIAVVGTRHQSEYGAAVTYSIAYDMAKAGVIVVSGLARGVDGMAHRAAIDAGGKTVAVLGGGVDRPYPAEHAELLEEITHNGAVLSEYRPFDSPASFHFPARNRVISGLSVGTLVVEAPRSSGALITARDALMQGRDLFAVPGKLGENNSTGTNDLIKNGAAIATCASDVIERYLPLYPGRLDPAVLSVPKPKLRKPPAMPKPGDLPERFDPEEEKREEPDAPSAPGKRSEKPAKHRGILDRLTGNREPEKPPAAPSVPLSEAEEAILALIPIDGSVSSDELIRLSGKPLSEVFTTLTVLEVKGVLRALPGGQFTRS